MFIALSARELHPGIAVDGRGETQPGLRRLRLAGADQVISIHHVGGQRIANAILRPAVVDFIELASPAGELPVDLEEVALTQGCPLEGTTISALQSHGLRVSAVAVIREGAAMLMPAGDQTLQAGDRVVAVGERDDLGRFAALALA